MNFKQFLKTYNRLMNNFDRTTGFTIQRGESAIDVILHLVSNIKCVHNRKNSRINLISMAWIKITKLDDDLSYISKNDSLHTDMYRIDSIQTKIKLCTRELEKISCECIDYGFVYLTPGSCKKCEKKCLGNSQVKTQVNKNDRI